ncbi:4a-hydroxytetrahydrobiopterin dehydratase [Aquimarina sp. AD10]|uniref:Putative pterin-4-alpha-carbinolamine dehydratase n=1 Tax=Aquimarina aggregata TaxID=1642818 RepID=A0A163C1N1_9FLAO|nr:MULTISPECIES: 4a-hydroxytetrahydrobiopterin dehydratase [Aquimarina]AXT60033.1 4a-hydroxytetrahydrobiopterin dehydratase [Aquimarina sp. AD10]KZS41976.1 pterin-4-alpha-carbinolamine dehydratase [Aquimarina aggregata]RKM96175.1 4a-hydroxytetrahydrobiopterin dehydratase [Aquimarina sp. AD10]
MIKLSESEIQKKLKEVDGWEYNENALHTTFEFNDFKDAFSVMTRIAFEAELQQHHPDWSNVYNKLQISLSTHDAGGITENDFVLAKTIDKIIEGDS